MRAGPAEAGGGGGPAGAGVRDRPGAPTARGRQSRGRWRACVYLRGRSAGGGATPGPAGWPHAGAGAARGVSRRRAQRTHSLRSGPGPARPDPAGARGRQAAGAAEPEARPSL